MIGQTNSQARISILSIEYPVDEQLDSVLLALHKKSKMPRACPVESSRWTLYRFF